VRGTRLRYWKIAYEGNCGLPTSAIVSAALEESITRRTFHLRDRQYSIVEDLDETNAATSGADWRHIIPNRRLELFQKIDAKRFARQWVLPPPVYTHRRIFEIEYDYADEHRPTLWPIHENSGRGIKSRLFSINTFFFVHIFWSKSNEWLFDNGMKRMSIDLSTMSPQREAVNSTLEDVKMAIKNAI